MSSKIFFTEFRLETKVLTTPNYFGTEPNIITNICFNEQKNVAGEDNYLGIFSFLLTLLSKRWIISSIYRKTFMDKYYQLTNLLFIRSWLSISSFLDRIFTTYQYEASRYTAQGFSELRMTLASVVAALKFTFVSFWCHKSHLFNL